MFDGFGVNPVGLAEKRADQVDIVDAVIEDFEPGNALEKGPVFPWGVDGDPDFDFVERADRVLLDQAPGPENIGGVAELEVDGGAKRLFAGDSPDGSGFFKGFSHRTEPDATRIVPPDHNPRRRQYCARRAPPRLPQGRLPGRRNL